MSACPALTGLVRVYFFHVESLRILSSPLEIPARLEVCKTLLLTGPAEHKADTSGIPFLTGSRISVTDIN